MRERVNQSKKAESLHRGEEYENRREKVSEIGGRKEH